ncbi:zinc binding dehydrogenase, putative [Talaromyces stipitatus ATCC 10500]|uniref:Zinc binding dehydrogenase, putative n=1 Tax=Talaromyces stipitatus (strain ATCC 10500 / CBS 375.48 / QM 6759 / NRRL 1006) TaxID=441959 RepID=B8MEL2_TALSN|nr:zinc binding dehydrogenase, putative [Talaromyces stipitatus ATCC 10500]EED16639.1 zinc binding dehydrogenase, putative [Talaromyces stipitatus ATCC 10500]
MAIPQTQTAVIQTNEKSTLPLTVSESVPTFQQPSDQYVLVRVLAVALNPTDFKMVQYFPIADNLAGCDFCGVVEACGNEETSQQFPPGTRVCGAVFPYNPQARQSGSFAQWVIADSGLLLKVPDGWNDLDAAAVGGVGWGTAVLAFYDPDALALTGRPTKKSDEKEPVLVYGAGTASGTMACQLLNLSGYAPIAIASSASADMAMKYGAIGTADYTSPSCADAIKKLAGGAPIRHVLDCIASAESAAMCFSLIARTGGRYACLEGLNPAWKTRRTVKVKEVMGFEGLGIKIDLGPTSYSRDANLALRKICCDTTKDIQIVMDAGLLKPHPVREVPGQWQGIIDGLAMLQRGEVRGQKLVVRVSST